MHAFSPLIYNRTSGLYLFKTKFKSFLHQLTENWINSTINHHLSFRGINLFPDYQEIPGYGTSDEICNSEFSPGMRYIYIYSHDTEMHPQF